MLIDVVQNKTSVQVSYTNEKGEIAIENLPLPPEGYTNWKLCDEEDPDQSTEFKNHDGRAVKRVSSYRFEDLNLTEFLTKRLPQETHDRIFAFHKPAMFSVDIETRITDDAMPDAETTPTDVLSISITAPNLATVILMTKDCNLAKSLEIVNGYLHDYAEEHGLQFPVKHFVFETEKEMLSFFLDMMRKRFHLIAGWNFTGYDWPYITGRAIKNGLNIEQASPIGKVEDGIPVHRLVIDYMGAYKAGSRGSNSLLSYSLNSVADHELGLKKIEYPKTLKELYEEDYDRFIAYAIVDTILVQLIHLKTNKIDVMFNMCYYTKCPFKRSDGNIAQTDALQFEELYARNQVYADEREEKEKRKYEGAFVKEPVYHECDFPSAYDAKSLYPSTILTYDISPELYVGKCRKDEVEKLRKRGFFVTDKLSVYRRKEGFGTFKQMEIKLMDERKVYKTAMLDLEARISVMIEEEAKRRGIKLKDNH